jgi:hypothetical protein
VQHRTSATARGRERVALAYAGYGRLHQQQGDVAQARAYLTRALAIFERLGTLREPERLRQLLGLQADVCQEAQD